MRVRRPALSGSSGFSLIELVIVIAIIGLVAAIAVPRFTRASRAAGEAALTADLKLFRQAIEHYQVEHDGDIPALRDAGDGVGLQNGEAFKRQLTWYTNADGRASQAYSSEFYLGPYLRKIPPLPVGSRAGETAVHTTNVFSTPGLAGDGFGWEYEHYYGRIRANCPAEEVGSNSVPYYEW